MDVDSASPADTETYADAETRTASQEETSAAAEKAEVAETPNTNATNTVDVEASPPASQEVPTPLETDGAAEAEDEACLAEVDELKGVWTRLQDLVSSLGLLHDLTAVNDDEWFVAQMSRAVDALNEPPNPPGVSSSGASKVMDAGSKDVEEDNQASRKGD